MSIPFSIGCGGGAIPIGVCVVRCMQCHVMSCWSIPSSSLVLDPFATSFASQPKASYPHSLTTFLLRETAHPNIPCLREGAHEPTHPNLLFQVSEGGGGPARAWGEHEPVHWALVVLQIPNRAMGAAAALWFPPREVMKAYPLYVVPGYGISGSPVRLACNNAVKNVEDQLVYKLRDGWHGYISVEGVGVEPSQDDGATQVSHPVGNRTNVRPDAIR